MIMLFVFDIWQSAEQHTANTSIDKLVKNFKSKDGINALNISRSGKSGLTELVNLQV